MEEVLTSRISQNAGKGRQAIEWVIDKIDTEVKEIATAAFKSTDEILSSTIKSIDDIKTTARKSMDDISNKTKKSLDDLTAPNTRQNNLPEF